MASLARTTLQHRVWRWHFFAGLMVVPFAVVLAITGSVYLFKPQFEASVEASINARALAFTQADVLPADQLLEAALSTYPEGTFRRLTMPRSPDDPTVEIELRSGGADRILWIDKSSGQVLHDVPKDRRLMNVVKDIHGNLLAGNNGSYIVELMASWMIVLIITGIVLWWPRGSGWKAVFAPRITGIPRREMLRRLHGAGGAWIGGMVLILLVSGLPWTQVWGEGFDRAQKAFGWDSPGQEWVVTLQSGHPYRDGLDLWERGAGEEAEVTLTSRDPSASATPVSLETIAQKSTDLALEPPVEIQPPKGDNGVWTIRSMTQDRPHRVTVHYDRWSAEEIMRITFGDYHPVKQVASYGIALHEGALFGPLNQVMGLIAALGVIALSITGTWMWWRRRPAGQLGVPPLPASRRVTISVSAAIISLAIFLPLVGLSLSLALAADWLITRLQGRSVTGSW